MKPPKYAALREIYKTAAALTALNYVLKAGQRANESDTGKSKLGNGVTAYNELPYEKAGVGPDEIDTTLKIDGNNKLGVNLDEVTSRDDFDTLVGALVPHPTYDQPTSGVATNAALTGEIGTAINNFIVSLTFIKRDAGEATAYQIRKNGNPVSATNSFTDSIVLAATAIAFQGSVSYGEGPTKNNIIGIPDPYNKIMAGTAVSNTLNFIGYYASWYGPTAAAPASSAAVRALAGKQLTNASNTFILNTGTVEKIFAIITAPGKSLASVVDLDSLNANITSEYVLQGNIAVNDAAGNAIAGCKLYLKTPAVPYSSNKRHQITLS